MWRMQWPRSVCLCMLFTTTSCAKTAEPIETPQCGMWARADRVTAVAHIYSGKEAFGGDLPSRCEADEIPGMRQSYSLGGSSDADFRCQCCSNCFYHLGSRPECKMSTKSYSFTSVLSSLLHILLSWPLYVRFWCCFAAQKVECTCKTDFGSKRRSSIY